MAFATALGTGAGLVQLAAFVLYIRSLRRGRDAAERDVLADVGLWEPRSLLYCERTGAPAPVLLVPVFCALLSMWVAFRAFVGGPSVPAARHDWLVLAVDVAILGGYLAHVSGRLPGEGVDTLFLLLPAASSVLSFWPMLRSTCLDPSHEQPLGVVRLVGLLRADGLCGDGRGAALAVPCLSGHHPGDEHPRRAAGDGRIAGRRTADGVGRRQGVGRSSEPNQSLEAGQRLRSGKRENPVAVC